MPPVARYDPSLRAGGPSLGTARPRDERRIPVERDASAVPVARIQPAIGSTATRRLTIRPAHCHFVIHRPGHRDSSPTPSALHPGVLQQGRPRSQHRADSAPLASRQADPDRSPPRRACRVWRAGRPGTGGALDRGIWQRFRGEEPAPHAAVRGGVPG